MALTGGLGCDSPSSPAPAKSVASLDIGGGDSQGRLVEVFITDEAAASAVQELGTTIAAMPEVEAYTFVNKEQALEEFREKLGADADQILENLPTNPLPASFRMLVRDRSDVKPVARRFFDDPTIDNSPGTHDGVRYMSDTAYEYLNPSP